MFRWLSRVLRLWQRAPSGSQQRLCRRSSFTGLGCPLRGLMIPRLTALLFQYFSSAAAATVTTITDRRQHSCSRGCPLQSNASARVEVFRCSQP